MKGIPMRKFYQDAILSIGVVTCVVGGVTLLTFSQPPGSPAEMEAGLAAVVLSGALLVAAVISAPFLLAIRPGLVAGPVAALALCFAGLQAYDIATKVGLNSLNTEFAQPLLAHKTVIIPDSTALCEQRCIQLIDQTNLIVVVDNASSPKAYKRGRGEICFRPENAASLMTSALYGHANLCAVEVFDADTSNALVFEWIDGRSAAVRLDIPSNYEGSVIQVIERVDGRDRLLSQSIGASKIGWLVQYSVGQPFGNILNQFLGTTLVDGDAKAGTDDIVSRVRGVAGFLTHSYDEKTKRLLVFLYIELLWELRQAAWNEDAALKEASVRVQQLLLDSSPEVRRRAKEMQQSLDMQNGRTRTNSPQ
jgi:hypothetical protein